jgi:hypothetical protein
MTVGPRLPDLRPFARKSVLTLARRIPVFRISILVVSTDMLGRPACPGSDGVRTATHSSAPAAVDSTTRVRAINFRIETLLLQISKPRSIWLVAAQPTAYRQRRLTGDGFTAANFPYWPCGDPWGGSDAQGVLSTHCRPSRMPAVRQLSSPNYGRRTLCAFRCIT